MDITHQLEAHIITDLSDDDCWLTDISPTGRGYVTMQYQGKRVYVHRLAWELYNAEPIPDGLYVLHSCDNPGCCNPNHLRVGTAADNAHDRESRGRGNRITLRGPDRKPRKRRCDAGRPRKRNADGTFAS